MSINVTPIPRLIDLAAPSFTLGTANAAGSAVTAIASDSTLLTFDTTLPAATGTAAVGTATVAPRRDHVHAGTSLASATPAGVAATAVVGTGSSAARADHVHVGVGGTATYDGNSLTCTSGAQSPNQLYLINTSATASPGLLAIYHNSTSPANGDNAGQIEFVANDSGGTKRTINRIAGVQTDVTATSQDSTLYFSVQNNANDDIWNLSATLSSAGVWTDASGEEHKTYEGSSVEVWGGKEGHVVTDKLKDLSGGRYHSARSAGKPIRERHAGPTAEQFFELFGLGEDPAKYNPGIAPKDLAAVALLAVQELIVRIEALEK